MDGGEASSIEDVSAATNQQLLAHYAEVMAELMVRGREEHREHWGQEEGPPGALVAVGHDVLLETYRAVHDEMMARQTNSPGAWDPRGTDDRLT